MDDTKIYASVAIPSHPEFAVVTANDTCGYGVFSWHVEKEHAIHNAKVLGGRWIPVDYINGNLIIPPLAVTVTKKGIDISKFFP